MEKNDRQIQSTIVGILKCVIFTSFLVYSLRMDLFDHVKTYIDVERETCLRHFIVEYFGERVHEDGEEHLEGVCRLIRYSDLSYSALSESNGLVVLFRDGGVERVNCGFCSICCRVERAEQPNCAKLAVDLT